MHGHSEEIAQALEAKVLTHHIITLFLGTEVARLAIGLAHARARVLPAVLGTGRSACRVGPTRGFCPTLLLAC